MDGFWAGVVLVVMTFAAFTAISRLEDVALRQMTRPERQRVRITGLAITALGLLAGWPVPSTTGSGDLALLAGAVLSVSALVVAGQVAAILAFMFGRWAMRRLVHA